MIVPQPFTHSDPQSPPPATSKYMFYEIPYVLPDTIRS